MDVAHVTAKPLHGGKISPFIYGEFVEFVNDLIPGMWAELLRDRSFRGQTQPLAFYNAEEEFNFPAWETFTCLNTPTGGVDYHSQPHTDSGAVTYSRDFSDPWIGEYSPVITFSGARIMRHQAARRAGEEGNGFRGFRGVPGTPYLSLARFARLRARFLSAKAPSGNPLQLRNELLAPQRTTCPLMPPQRFARGLVLRQGQRELARASPA